MNTAEVYRNKRHKGPFGSKKLLCGISCPSFCVSRVRESEDGEAVGTGVQQSSFEDRLTPSWALFLSHDSLIHRDSYRACTRLHVGFYSQTDRRREDPCHTPKKKTTACFPKRRLCLIKTTHAVEMKMQPTANTY